MDVIKTEVQVVVVGPQESGRKIQSFIEARLGTLPQGLFMRLIRSGQIRIDGRRCKPFDRVQTGQQIRIPPLVITSRQKTATAAQPLEIFYEDQDMVVVNKPAFLPVHRGTNWKDSMYDRLQALYPDFVPIPVHRLDKDTSGLILCAATHAFLRTMHDLWAQVTRAYLCWIAGAWTWTGWRTVKSPVKKMRVGDRERVVCSQGLQAMTHVHVLETRPHATLVLALLDTGRTHQIRAHMAHNFLPILGDSKYGQYEQGQGLKLHAALLSWEKYSFFCPPPWSKPYVSPFHDEGRIRDLLTLAPAPKT